MMFFSPKVFDSREVEILLTPMLSSIIRILDYLIKRRCIMWQGYFIKIFDQIAIWRTELILMPRKFKNGCLPKVYRAAVMAAKGQVTQGGALTKSGYSVMLTSWITASKCPTAMSSNGQRERLEHPCTIVGGKVGRLPNNHPLLHTELMALFVSITSPCEF